MSPCVPVPTCTVRSLAGHVENTSFSRAFCNIWKLNEPSTRHEVARPNVAHDRVAPSTRQHRCDSRMRRKVGSSKGGFQITSTRLESPWSSVGANGRMIKSESIHPLGCVSASTPATLLLPGCCYSLPRLHVFRHLCTR